MKTADVVRHYGTQTAAAAALGIDQSSVSGWGEFPPDKRQLQIERLTDGALKAEPGCYERALGLELKSA
jgi:transcriptional repressor of cell division inhibition gene dicB